MKVEIKKKNQIKEREFPKLMIAHNGVIVLFNSKSEGMILRAGEHSSNVGTISCSFDESYYKDFEGSITLSND